MRPKGLRFPHSSKVFSCPNYPQVTPNIFLTSFNVIIFGIYNKSFIFVL
nr:MAG TPA: hypothetical protein [Microviridae sp.]